jgi:galactose-1-phosphate uridylyltransferase
MMAAAKICNNISDRLGKFTCCPICWVMTAIKLPTSKQKSRIGLFRLITLISTAQAIKKGTDSTKIIKLDSSPSLNL